MDRKEIKQGIKFFTGYLKKARKKRNDLVEDLKMEIASELGLIEQIKDKGWKFLSPKLLGKIGGKVSKRLKKLKK